MKKSIRLNQFENTSQSQFNNQNYLSPEIQLRTLDSVNQSQTSQNGQTTNDIQIAEDFESHLLILKTYIMRKQFKKAYKTNRKYMMI